MSTEKEVFPPPYETESDLIQAMFKSRPKRHYKEPAVFLPFIKLCSDDYLQRLDLRYLLTPTRRRIHIITWDNEKRDVNGKSRRIDLTTSEERVMKFAADIVRRFSGGVEVKMEKKTAELILEFYFKRRRDRGKNPLVAKVPFIQRMIIHDCIQDGEIYPGQVVERYGVSASRGISLLNQMYKFGLLKRSRKIGRVFMYSLAVDPIEVKRLLEALRAITDLVHLPSVSSQQSVLDSLKSDVGRS